MAINLPVEHTDLFHVAKVLKESIKLRNYSTLLSRQNFDEVILGDVLISTLINTNITENKKASKEVANLLLNAKLLARVSRKKDSNKAAATEARFIFKDGSTLYRFLPLVDRIATFTIETIIIHYSVKPNSPRKLKKYGEFVDVTVDKETQEEQKFKYTKKDIIEPDISDVTGHEIELTFNQQSIVTSIQHSKRDRSQYFTNSTFTFAINPQMSDLKLNLTVYRRSSIKSTPLQNVEIPLDEILKLHEIFGKSDKEIPMNSFLGGKSDDISCKVSFGRILALQVNSTEEQAIPQGNFPLDIENSISKISPPLLANSRFMFSRAPSLEIVAVRRRSKMIRRQRSSIYREFSKKYISSPSNHHELSKQQSKIKSSKCLPILARRLTNLQSRKSVMENQQNNKPKNILAMNASQLYAACTQKGMMNALRRAVGCVLVVGWTMWLVDSEALPGLSKLT